jgi:hypothetical protein
MNSTINYLLEKFKPEEGGNPLEIHNVNRTIMTQTLAELGFNEGAEIGVAEGYHAEVMGKNIPGLKLHCVDIWEMYPGYEEYPEIESIYYEAVKRLQPYNMPFYREFSTKALRHFPDNSLDFVYIDGGHDFLNVSMDICGWSKKVRPGGIVSGHDYKRSRKNVVHVKDVVPAYMYAHSISPWFVLTNDVRDQRFGRDNPGWLFVRQEGDQI